MLPCILFFLAGVVTGIHVLGVLSLTAYGVGFSPLELISLLGSLCLVIAAFISLFRPRTAARLALIATLVIWSFYGPAIANQLRTNRQHVQLVSSDYRILR